MPWAGNECSILAAALSSGTPPTEGGASEEGALLVPTEGVTGEGLVSPVTAKDDGVNLVRMEWVGDKPKETD